MKNRIYILLAFFISMAFLFNACEPEEFDLGEPIAKDQLSYTISPDDSDPNMIIIESLTPGLTPLWVTPLGRSTRVKDTVKLAFPGTYKFVYGVQSAGGFIQDDTVTLNITTTNLEYVNDPLWNLLTGGVGEEKIWYLDLDAEAVSKYWAGPLYFSGLDYRWEGECIGDDCWTWEPDYPGNSWLMPTGDYGSMTFSLKGNAEVTVDHKMLGRVEEGTYFLDAKAHTLKMTDAGPLHDAGRDGQVIDWGDLKIISLTENTLQLAALRDEALSGEGPVLLIYNYISKEYADNWVPVDEAEPEPPYDGNANTDLTTDVSTSITWKVNIDYPYNWHGLDGTALNTVATYASDPEGFAFTTWTPPYDEAVFSSISMTLTKGGENDGTYVVETGTTTYDGTYTVDEKNNIDFGQPIQFFSGVGGWLSYSTTAENTLRLLMVEKGALGNIEGMWLGQRATDKDEYLSLHFEATGGGGGDDPGDAVKEMLCAKTWKIDSDRTYDVATSWGAEQGPIIFSDYATWSWNPLPGEHYAAGEAGIDYGTMKFELNGTVTINQHRRIYTYDDGGNTVVRNGMPQPGDVLETDDVVTLNGIWVMDLDANTITLSVEVLHPWTCDYAVADWGDLTIYRIEENALLLQALRDPVLSGEDEFLMNYVYVPSE